MPDTMTERQQHIGQARNTKHKSSQKENFLLTPLEFNIHTKMGVLEAFCLTVDKDHDKTIHINDSVWETHNNGKGIEGKLTPEGTQKIGDYLRQNYACVFKPAHLVN